MNVPRSWQYPLALFVLALVLAVLVYQFPVTSVIDVGSGGDSPFIHGFSFRENLPGGGDTRWSNGSAQLDFSGVGAQDGNLKLRFAAPRPSAPAQVNIRVNGNDHAISAPSADLQEFIVPVQRADVGIGGDLIVTLNSDTFTQPPDTRRLGLLVESARFETNGAPVIPAPWVMLYLPAFVVLAYFIARAWIGSERLALAAAIVTLLLAAFSLYAARIETAHFLPPLFWLCLILFGGAYLFSIALQRLTNVVHAPAWTPRTLRLVFAAMVGAFALRMVFAVTPGFIVDVQDYIVWSYKTVTYGLPTMYASINGLWISDQSPGLNYVLHVMGLLYRGIFAPDFLYPVVAGDPALRGLSDNPALLADPVHRTLLRLPMLLADVLTGALIFTAARKYVAERLAWLAALAFWLNPAVLWNGAYWGQTDAIHALLVLVCFLLIIFTPRVGLAFFILGIAAFTKPQAMIFGPLLLLGVYKTTQVAGEGRNLKGVARAIVFGALGSALVVLPVVLTGEAQQLLAFLGDAVGHHPTLSANAHNLWWMVFHDDVFMPDTAAVFPGAPFSFRQLSIVLFGIVYVLVLVRAWRAALESFFVWGAFLAFAFFMLPTEIHENYGYALLPLLAVAMTRDTRLVGLYVAVSVTMTLNYALHDPPLFERFGLTDPHVQWAPLRWLNAVANMTILAIWMIYLFVRRDLNIALGGLVQPSPVTK